MSQLYPASEAHITHFLPVSDLHTLHVQVYGKEDGDPVVHVHGGPGGGTEPKDARRFDPSHYRIFLIDQRGSGKSTPPSCLEQNTTWDLVADIERVREWAKVDKWHVFGGSWGSTLSLAYAQTHPDRVKSLVLRGIFTLRKQELDFFYQGPGTSFLFADYWEEYISVIPEAERGDMVKAYYKRLTGDDEAERKKAGKAWSRWEMATSRLHVDPEYLSKSDGEDFADKFARIECHYFVNEGFFERDGQLLEKAAIDKIRHIPAVIVQGRYDVVCPFKTSWDLHKAWPEAEYKVIPDAGHSANESGIERELINATNKMKSISEH